MSGVIENIYILRICRRLLFIKGKLGEILKVGQIFRRCNLGRLFALLGTEYTALPQNLYAHPTLEDHTEYSVLAPDVHLQPLQNPSHPEVLNLHATLKTHPCSSLHVKKKK